MLKASSLFVLLSLLLNACQSTGQTPTPEDVSQTATPTGQATEISSEAPDLSGETITIFQIADPADEYVFSLLTAAQDMATAINESGGVFGAELRLELRESALDAESTIAAYEEIKETDPVLIVVYEPGQQAVLDGLAAEDRIPIFGAGPDAQALYGMDDGYVFTLAPLYADQFGRFLDFVVSNWSEIKPPQAEDFVRVAYLGWDTPLGQAGYSPEIIAYAEELEVEIVTTELYPYSPVIDAITPILNARSARANVIYINAYSFGAANVLNDLGNMAIREELVVGGAFYAMDALTYAYLSRPQNADRLYASFPSAWWGDTDNPAIQFALENLEENGRVAQQQTIGRLLMQGSVDVIRHVLEQAILEVGFEDLDGQAVYEALTGIEDYEVLGGLMLVDFTGGRRAPDMLQIRQIQGGLDAFVVVEDFSAAPDLRPVSAE